MKRHKASFFRFLSIVVLLVLTQQLQAQDSTVVLHLNDFIAQATTNNKNIQLAKMDEQIAASKYRETDAIFLPQVGLSYSAFSSNNPLNAFGFKLQEKSLSLIHISEPTRRTPI